MAVLVEAISVIVRRDAIDDLFPGGWDEFVYEVPNNTLCTDGKLVRVGFMSPDDVQEFVLMLRFHRLTFQQDGKAIHLAVVDQQRGATTPADWLEFARIPFGDTGKKVAAAWLFEGPRRGAGVHLPGGEFDLATPDGWRFDESLSAEFTFVPSEDVQDTLADCLPVSCTSARQFFRNSDLQFSATPPPPLQLPPENFPKRAPPAPPQLPRRVP